MLMALLTMLSCNSQKVDNSTVSAIDMDRFLGRWYEIARFDHSFERDMEFTTADYSLNDNGKLTVTNRGIKGGKLKTSLGKAKLTEMPGLLRVSFFGPFYSDYRILKISDDYNMALVGSGSDRYLWVLSRNRTIPDEAKAMILNEAASRGYKVCDLIWVRQKVNP